MSWGPSGCSSTSPASNRAPISSAIEEALDRCRVVLVLIGPRWVDARNADGYRRLDHSDDFVRREIEAAFERDLRVIPVLVRGARMPGPSEVPDSLAALSRCQAFVLNDEPWPELMTALVGVLTRSLRSSQQAGVAPVSRTHWSAHPAVREPAGRGVELRRPRRRIGPGQRADRLAPVGDLTGPGAAPVDPPVSRSGNLPDRLVRGRDVVRGPGPDRPIQLVPAVVADAVGVQARSRPTADRRARRLGPRPERAGGVRQL